MVYNALSQTPQKNLFPKAIKHNIGIIARVPLAYGALTGKFTKNTIFAEDDLRKRKYTDMGLDEILNIVDQYKKIVGSSERKKLISAALHFALDHNAVSITIPGIRSAKQAEENCSIYKEDNAPSKETIKALYNLQKQLI